MFKKNDTLLLQRTYISNLTRITQPHISPVTLGQVSVELSSVHLPSLASSENGYQNIKALSQNIDKLIKSLHMAHHLPWVNGSMNLMLHPKLFLCIELAKRYGLVEQNLFYGTDPIKVSWFIREYQDSQHTHYFNELKKTWEHTLKLSEQELSHSLKLVNKVANGFALHEFISIIDSSPINSLHLNEFIEDVKNGFIVNMKEDELLAIFLKKEPLPNRQMRLRFIILLKRDFLDSPAHLTDLSSFEKIKLSVEQTHSYQILYDPSLLNGYMQSNLYHKKTQSFKEQIKQLRVYLTGTDALYRIGSVEPTFSVLYTKVKVQCLEGV